MRYPVLSETDALQEALEAAQKKKTAGMAVYYEFFESLGFPKKAQMQMDQDDFLDLITFVLTPKKKRSAPTD